MKFNFEKLKIVKFNDGTYAVRKGIFRFQYLWLYDIDRSDLIWIRKSDRDAFKKFALTTNLRIAIKARELYLKRKDNSQDYGKVLSEDEIFFTDLQNKQEQFASETNIAKNVYTTPTAGTKTNPF